MKGIWQFILNFTHRSGGYVFTTTIFSRLLSFFASWIVLQLVSNKDLGAVIYSFQIISFIIPITGLGLNQGLIRYGAQLKTKEDKDSLFIYTLKYGIFIGLILIGLVILVSFLIKFKLEKIHFYVPFLSFAILSTYILELIKIQFRLLKNNKLFALVELTYTILLVAFVFVLSFYFQDLGYATSLIAVPLLTALIFIKKLKINWATTKKLSFINSSFWKYGFFASLANVTTQLLFSIDILLIGSILINLEKVTAYKYVSILPFSFLFLSQVVITTDFVNFTEKINQKGYIKTYIKNYTKLFSLISAGCLLFVIVFGKIILSFFEKDYSQYYSVLVILTVGISGILIVRSLFGNLLSSIGKASTNFIITSIALLLNIILNYILIPKYGILGAAITSSLLMWFTAVLSMILFYYYFKKQHTF